MAAGLKVTVGCTPDCGATAAARGGKETTCAKPAGAGSEEQKLPEVTFAGMPYLARSLCRVAGSRSSFGLRISVALPAEFLTILNEAVRIVPGAKVRIVPRAKVRIVPCPGVGAWAPVT